MDIVTLENQAITEFLSIVNRQQAVLARIEDQITTQPIKPIENKYRRQGQKAKDKKANRGSSNNSLEIQSRSEDLREARLHEKIVEYPFLLHTPELYAGELLLNSIIDELALPNKRRADFAFISGQNQVIKISLVEIKRASDKVFKDNAQKTEFSNKAKKWISQVEEWRDSFASEDRKKSLLLSLKPLFKNYPVPLLTLADNVARETQIEIDYILIAGNEKIDTPKRQHLVDSLYLENDILLMPYPEMIEHVKRHPRPKHMISIWATGVHVKTSSPSLPHFGDLNEDPLGVKMAGLGMNHFDTSRRRTCFHPETLREIFYRSAGACEIPGCGVRIVSSDGVQGHLTPIYNNFPERSTLPFEALLWREHTALLCGNHIAAFNEGEISTLGNCHFLKEKLQHKSPYRAHLDHELMEFMIALTNRVATKFLTIANCSETESTLFAKEITQWIKSISSIPVDIRQFYQEIVVHYFKNGKPTRGKHTESKLLNSLPYYYLTKARLLRKNPETLEIEPTMLDELKKTNNLSDIYRAFTYYNMLHRNGHSFHY